MAFKNMSRLSEILESSANYFGSLENLSYSLENLSAKEYPLPEKELKNLLESIKNCLICTNEKLDTIKLDTIKKSDLTEEQIEKQIEGFRFYFRELTDNDISPIVVLVDRSSVKIESEKNISVKPIYCVDLWNWDALLNKNRLPKLETNNFYDNFKYKHFDYVAGAHLMSEEQKHRKTYQDFYEKAKEELFWDYASSSREEYYNDLFKRFKENNLLQGDLHFSRSTFKDFLMNKDLKIPEEFYQKLQIELDDRKVLRNINFQGQEISIQKTPYQIWEEFKKNNTELFQNLIRVCQYSYRDEEYSKTKPERTFLLAKAFSLLRVQGLDPIRLITSA